MPQASLDSFAPEFRQGMAARAARAGRRRREQPGALGEAARQPRRPRRPGGALARRRAARGRASSRRAAPTRSCPGVEVIWRQDCYQLPTGRTSFGFKDGIGQPAVEGSGRPPVEPAGAAAQGGRDHPRLPGRDRRAAADADPGGARPQRHLRRLPQAAHEGGGLPAVPAREGREPRGGGAARREDGRALAERRAARALPRSATTPSSARDPQRNNDFLYGDDPRGFKCPAGAHARRANPRDALDGDGSVDVRLHRMIRRGTSYGPMLPDGVLEDDGADRGIIFVFAGAHLKRQFEFVKTQWLNDGIFIGAPAREGPARRAERRDRHASRSRSGRSAAGCRTCRRSSSPAAASTASRPACARCAGWPSSTP